MRAFIGRHRLLYRFVTHAGLRHDAYCEASIARALTVRRESQLCIASLAFNFRHATTVTSRN